MGNIKQMSTKLANMIAAGEVVERPLNIIKELVENSIDAKANKISIYLKDGGLTEIKVIDNGCGMDEEDIKMCFKPHATSKLLNEYDLFRIKTLGFRGEALASIASVANVSLTSKKIDDKAYNIVYRFGNLISFNETAAETGTTIIVTDLFYNTPARLKYLKTASQELAAITALVDKLSLSSPNVMFVLYNDNRLVARTDGKNNMTSLIGYIYGLEASKKIVDLSFDEQGFSGKLYYIKPDIYRSNKNQMTYIINGRYVRYYALNDLLIEAFKGYLPINKYPILVLYLTIDPLLIDVNIHPKKEEIKIAEPQRLFKIIYDLIKNSLINSNGIKNINHKDNSSPSNTFLSNVDNNVFNNKEEINEENNFFNNEKINLNFYNKIDTVKETNDNFLYDTPKEYDLFNDGKDFLKLNYIGTFLKTYIICEANDSLYILDQHACAERVKYEYYAEKMNNPNIVKTSFLVPVNLEFTKEEIIYLNENIDKYNELGFNLEIVGLNVRVHEIPVWASKEYEDIIREILKSIMSNKQINIIDFRDAICKQISCKASIRANDYLNKDEILALLRDLEKCKNPYHCPHGRPTIIKFSKKELEKMFARIEE